MIITEATIDKILDQLQADEAYQETLTSRFETMYEEYVSYLNQEIITLLSEEEGDLLHFVHAILLEAFLRADDSLKIFEMDDFYDAEESMWSSYEDNIKAPFRDRITTVFDASDEEDALAFIEDTLVDPEEGEDFQLSATGRDVIWNVCAAFVTVLVA